MKRKQFLASLIATGAAVKSFGETVLAQNNGDIDAFAIIPPYLKANDTIGITCPAGYIKTEELQPAVNKILEWGFKVSIGSTVGKKDFGFGGTDHERLEDFQQMLNDRNIKAIMCARGGYGAVRLIDQINFKKFISHPKWIIGFSDITVMHSHINRNFNIASLHSKMCNSFPSDWSQAEFIQADTIESIRKCLLGEKMEYITTPNDNNRIGIATGQLIGGNLKTLESLAGSKSDIITTNKILFLEDTGEYLYSIDRMFWNLKRSNKLSHLKGLIIGGIIIKKDDKGEEFGKSVEEIVLEKVKEYKYPVCFDFPVGHQKNNYALKCGIMHRLEVAESQTTLNEIKIK